MMNHETDVLNAYRIRNMHSYNIYPLEMSEDKILVFFYEKPSFEWTLGWLDKHNIISTPNGKISREKPITILTDYKGDWRKYQFKKTKKIQFVDRLQNAMRKPQFLVVIAIITIASLL